MTKEEKIYLRTLCPKCSEFIDIEYVDEELQALRAWKAKARPFLEDQYYAFKNELECEGEFELNPETKAEYEVWFKLLTELLGGSDE